MKNKNYIQVFEHQTLRIDGDSFLQKHLDSLAVFQQQNGNQYFELLYKAVKFKQFVGVLQVGDLTVEILPKTDQYILPKLRWQRFLLDLLDNCGYIAVSALSEAPLQLKTSPIFWIYIQLYVQTIKELLEEGLQKNYQQKEVNTRVWKGQVNFAKQLQKNSLRPQYVYTKLQTYDYQSPIHQVLYKALKILSQFWVSPPLTNQINYLLQGFPPQADIKVTAQWFDRLNLSRVSTKYKKALELAKLIVLQHSPDVRAGHFSVLALLFDMNLLFEKWIYRQLQKNLPQGWTIQGQVSKRFWANRRLKPDICLQYQGKNYILDTKWKILQRPNPSSEDLRQMYAYNHIFEARQSMLVYPNVFGLTNRIEPYTAPLWIEGEEERHCCQIVFVDLLDSQGNLNSKIASKIIALLK